MTSRERVHAVFNNQLPDRMPRWLGMSDEFSLKIQNYLDMDEEGVRRFVKDDFRVVRGRFTGSQENLAEGATWRSPFGVERKGIGFGMPLSHPLQDVTTPEELEAYNWPSTDLIDCSLLRDDISRYEGEYAILGGEWSPFWHDAIDLVGHEELYFLMFDYPETARLLFEKITDYYVENSRLFFEEAGDLTDIFFIGNDLGSQSGPLMGINQFREFLLPSIKRLVDLGHEYGLKVMMHCCGGYRPLIPSLIEIGMDGLHALQPDCHGMEPEGIKRDFGSHIVLNGAIDSHHILINGKSAQEVKQGCRRVLDIMGRGGAYIAGASHDTILEETPVENVLAMFEAVDEYEYL
ncbi:MAG: uroporphyrinogen decarboxylase family protein [Spirochaetales bacterium]|nr:uroporphyrinogen decarboxylase family protein [Spirochaetales bacterium]